MTTEPHRLIASLLRDQVALDLKTIDLCFLAALYLKATSTSLASFEEGLLVDLFEQLCDVVEPGADNPRKRATHAIQRLREQRMLARVDGAGLVRAGEYALTRLAAAIIDYFLADEALTRESLTLLTATLRAQLGEVLAAARKAQADDDWHMTIAAPLRITVSDLIGGIERRQRGLDVQQEEIQAEIASLLSDDWFTAVDHCQGLLDSTTATIQELNDILLKDTHLFLALLQDIQALAIGAGQHQVTEITQKVIEHIDRIAAWGGARQRAWSEYYQYVHRYLRDVVRLDPDRALSQRLRDQITGWSARPCHLVVADERSIRLLRPQISRLNPPPVWRPHGERELEPVEVEAEDPLDQLAAAVAAAIDQGAASLAEVTRRVLGALPADYHYLAAGRIAELLAAAADRLPNNDVYERPWRAVSAALEIEDWPLAPLSPRTTP